jgi:hypothetical protein
MTIKTKFGGTLQKEELIDYFSSLIDECFKILPMFEDGVSTLSIYIQTLLIELGGANRTICLNDKIFIKLIANLEPLLEIKDHESYKRQVFKCTNLCKKMIEKIMGSDEDGI